MMQDGKLSEDALAFVLACSQIGASKGREGDARPYSSGEWWDLQSRIAESSFHTPGALLGQPAERLTAGLGLPLPAGERLQRRLDRGTPLAIELDRLASIGIWIVTQADADYPARLKSVLERSAPAVLCGIGKRELLNDPGMAIAGSRHIPEATLDYAASLGRACVASALTVVSGAAKGVDLAAMRGALESDGDAVGVVADSLIRLIRSADTRRYIHDEHLVLITPYHPEAPFSVGNAMGRNRIIYALARWGVVVESTHGEGGTWAGAQEVLRHRWVPLFVRDSNAVRVAKSGNSALLDQGALRFPGQTDELPHDLQSWLEDAAVSWTTRPASQPKILPLPEGAAPSAEPPTVRKPSVEVFPTVLEQPESPRTHVSASPNEVRAPTLTSSPVQQLSLDGRSVSVLSRSKKRAKTPEARVKAALASQIVEIVREQGMDNAQAAETIHIDEPKYAALVEQRLERITISQLIQYADALGCEVDPIVKRPCSASSAGPIGAGQHASASAGGASLPADAAG